MKLKDKIIKNRVGILIFIGVLLVVTIIIGISYAYFFNIEIKNNNTISGNINTKYYTFESSGNSTLSLTINQNDLDMANASNDYSSFVSGNGGNINVSLNTNGLKKVYCSYDLVYEPVSAYTPSSGATNAGLKEFTLSGTSDKGNSFSEIDVSGSSAVTLISGIKISTDTNILENWSFTAKYYNLDVIQDNVAGKTFKGNIKVANTNCSFNEPARIGYEAILLDNGGDATTVDAAKAYIEGRTTSTTPNFASTATTNEGMYATEDDYTATTGMKSYYFRGAVNNNWVQFGKEGDKDIYWRIIRINGDGSIRMIYTGTTDPKNESSVTGSNGVYMTGTGTQITVDNTNGFEFNSSPKKAEYVGYQYIEGQQHGYGKCDGTNASCTVNGNTVYNSAIKQAIDKWYAGTTLKDNNLVADQIFCNDRSATTSENGTPGEISGSMSASTTYYYGARDRLYTNKSPQLKCPTASDKFTVNTSNGNGALTYPVGIITADEVAMAGGVYDSDNSSYYLYTNKDYWLASPYYFSSPGSDADEFDVLSSGSLHGHTVFFPLGARPVVSLSSKAKLSGNGTYSNPYTVS